MSLMKVSNSAWGGDGFPEAEEGQHFSLDVHHPQEEGESDGSSIARLSGQSSGSFFTTASFFNVLLSPAVFSPLTASACAVSMWGVSHYLENKMGSLLLGAVQRVRVHVFFPLPVTAHVTLVAFCLLL